MNRFTALRPIIFGLLFLAMALGQSSATEFEDTGVLLALELKNLSQTIDKLAESLESRTESNSRDSELRKMEIAIAYLNFRSRRIEMFERELQTAMAQRNRLEDFLVQFEREEENLDLAFDSTQQEALQRAQKDLSTRKQSFKDRIGRMDEEIILLENRIMDMRSQIDNVESFVEKNLVF
jgi:predicted  nucleic acid-binding Zn-ribbon protein